jgi:hypothetical protein
MVTACCEVVFSEMHLGLDDGKLITEVMQLIVLSTISFDFGGGISVVEVGNSTTESVVGGGRTVEQSVEPDRDGLCDILG